MLVQNILTDRLVLCDTTAFAGIKLIELVSNYPTNFVRIGTCWVKILVRKIITCPAKSVHVVPPDVSPEFVIIGELGDVVHHGGGIGHR